MRVPLSWLAEHVDLPADVDARRVADLLTAAGVEVDAVHDVGTDVTGVVVARVVSFVEEEHSNGKTVRWCVVDDGEVDDRGVVCGALTFAEGDLVALARPGALLPGGFAIAARSTYGHVSDGMICSARELGLGDDHAGILVLPEGDGIAPGADAVALLGLRDAVLELAVTPDRGYALSLRGVAREVAIGLGQPFRDPGGPDAVEAPAVTDDGWEVGLPDSALPEAGLAGPGCDRYVARVLSGLDPSAASPLHWQARLVRAGMRPISAAVDATNLVMLELGQPLHAFDAAKVRGAVVVRRAREGERLRTLDGVDRRLHPEDLLITDDSGPIALAGVMGGESTELRVGGTTEVLLESAHFDPVSVGRTARRHGLPSEASRRFERGVDPDLAGRAAQRAVELLGELAGARDTGRVTDAGQPAAPAEVHLPVDLPARVAGVPYTSDVVVGRLRDVGCEVRGDGDLPDGQVTAAGAPLRVLPPPWRPDLRDPYDLVEEVARLQGYADLPSVVPRAPGGRGLSHEQRARRRAADALAAAGFVEVPSYPFLSPAVLVALGLGEGDPRRRTLPLANPLSEEESAMRSTLLPGLLAALRRNRARGSADLALFEVGAVVLLPPGREALPDAPRLPVDRGPTTAELASLDAALPAQPRLAAVVACGELVPGGWWGPGRPAGWADAVDAVRLLAEAVGARLTVRAGARAPWHPGRCAELLVGGAEGPPGAQDVVGHAGELHPRVCAALELPERTVAAEVDLDRLVAAGGGLVAAPPVSPFPAAAVDVAVVVDEAVPAAAVREALADGAAAVGAEVALEALRLFDVYRGAPLAAGEKSLAYALRLRATDRTLQAEEVTGVRDAALAEARRRTGARART